MSTENAQGPMPATRLRFFEPGETRVKICGVTRAEDAEAIAGLGADAIGMNLWPGSKRHTTLEAAGPWLVAIAGRLTRVAVFVNAAEGEIAAALDTGLVDAAQLHGDESPEVSARLRERGYPVYQALRVRDPGSLARIADYGGPVILLDAYSAADYGGTGEKMDWALGRQAVEQNPGRSIILAGGLTPENVAAAVCQVRPHAVDVASGVESAPGVKDIALVRRFVQSAKTGVKTGT